MHSVGPTLGAERTPQLQTATEGYVKLSYMKVFEFVFAVFLITETFVFGCANTQLKEEKKTPKIKAITYLFQEDRR